MNRLQINTGNEKIWWPDYDFIALMQWGWAASRTIDYLYTLSYVNREQYASFSDNSNCVDEVKKVYGLYKGKDNIELFALEYYNRFSNEIKGKMISLMKENFK